MRQKYSRNSTFEAIKFGRSNLCRTSDKLCRISGKSATLIHTVAFLPCWIQCINYVSYFNHYNLILGNDACASPEKQAKWRLKSAKIKAMWMKAWARRMRIYIPNHIPPTCVPWQTPTGPNEVCCVFTWEQEKQNHQ